jgi:hypothetical protein
MLRVDADPVSKQAREIIDTYSSVSDSLSVIKYKEICGTNTILYIACSHVNCNDDITYQLHKFIMNKGNYEYFGATKLSSPDF